LQSAKRNPPTTTFLLCVQEFAVLACV
jgi:hypothetical protein